MNQSMKYAILSALAAFAFSTTLSSQALAANPGKSGSTCTFGFEAKGTDIQIFIGYSKLRGEGKITCIDNVSGKVDERAFKITIGTPVLFPRISFAPSLVVRGAAENIEILKGGPSVLLDEYLTMDIRGAIGGAGFARFLTLEGQNNGLSINMGLEDIEGFGLAVGGTKVTLE